MAARRLALKPWALEAVRSGATSEEVKVVESGSLE